MSARNLILLGSTVRITYGLISLFAPKVIFALGGEEEVEDDTRYFNALFGGRDLTVAGLTIAALKAGREREALLANVSCEATDLVALLQEIRQRGGVDSTAAAGIAFNVAGWTTWALAARQLD
jgi:hypothetical protein